MFWHVPQMLNLISLQGAWAQLSLNLEPCHNPWATPKQSFWFVRMHLLLSWVLIIFVSLVSLIHCYVCMYDDIFQ